MSTSNPSPFFLMRFGSHVYGTNTPTSDNDYKGIFLPAPRDIILGKSKSTITESTKVDQSQRNTAADTDTELFSLQRYISLLLEGQTVALTMLFAPKEHIITNSPIYDEIVTNREKFLHSGVSAFAGYCRAQANKYGIKGSRMGTMRLAMEFFEWLGENYGWQSKLSENWDHVIDAFLDKEHCEFLTYTHPEGALCAMLSVCNRKVQEHVSVKNAYNIYKNIFNEYGQRALQAESNENIDWKALMHAVRVAGEAHELLTSHVITYPRPNAAVLKQIRLGELPYAQVAEIIEQGLIDLEAAQQISTLPTEPDREYAEQLVFEYYGGAIIGHFYETMPSAEQCSAP